LTALRGVSGASSTSASSWPDKDQGNESWSASLLSSSPASENGRFRVLLRLLRVDVLFGDDCIFWGDGCAGDRGLAGMLVGSVLELFRRAAASLGRASSSHKNMPHFRPSPFWQV
jgi:hypothetical protein